MDHTLLYILLAILLSGIVSISAAAACSFYLLSKTIHRMVSLSVGIMLATAILHALPEAFESGADPHHLFIALLGGILGFFLLEKLSVLRHSHHHEHDGHCHDHGFDKRSAGRSGWMILVGDGLHNFTDGILIAAAFMTDPYLGIMTCIAIFVHEIPQEASDFIILLNAGFTKTRAYVYNLISSGMALLGGLVGYLMLEHAHSLVPYVLVVASAGFIYIAVCDLMPEMHQPMPIHETALQVILIGLGVCIILALNTLMHTAH